MQSKDCPKYCTSPLTESVMPSRVSLAQLFDTASMICRVSPVSQSQPGAIEGGVKTLLFRTNVLLASERSCTAAFLCTSCCVLLSCSIYHQAYLAIPFILIKIPLVQLTSPAFPSRPCQQSGVIVDWAQCCLRTQW